jgi:hypothetical protein
MKRLDKWVDKQYSLIWAMLGLFRSILRIGYVRRRMKNKKRFMDLCGKALYESVNGNDELIDLMELNGNKEDYYSNKIGGLLMNVTAITNGLEKFTK